MGDLGERRTNRVLARLAIIMCVAQAGCGGGRDLPATVEVLDDPPELTARQLDVVGREPVDPVALAEYTNTAIESPRATLDEESGALTIHLRFDGLKWPWVQRGFWLLEPHDPQNAQHPRPTYPTPLLVQLRDDNGVTIRTDTTELFYGPSRYHSISTKKVKPSRLDRIIAVDDGVLQLEVAVSRLEMEHLASVAVGFSAQAVVLRQRVLGTESEVRTLLTRRGPRAKEMARRTGSGNTVEEILGLPPAGSGGAPTKATSEGSDDIARLVTDSAVEVGDAPLASPHDTKTCQKVADKLAAGAGENLATLIRNARPAQLTLRRDSAGEPAELWLVAPLDLGGQRGLEGVTHFVRPPDGGPDWKTEGWGCSTEMMWSPGLFGHEWVPAALQGRPWRRQPNWSAANPAAAGSRPLDPNELSEPGWSRQVPAGPEALPGDPVLLIDDETGVAKFEKQLSPSPARDRVTAEFDDAPRDPIGPSTLWDLYSVLRDFDGCDPSSAGYELSTDSVRILRNVPFARRGYTFGSPDLGNIFAKEPWYRPDPAVTASSPPSLPTTDQTCVAKLRTLEGGPSSQPRTDGLAVGPRSLRPHASGALKEGRLTKGAERLFDGDPNTEWADGVDGAGIGEWFGAELLEPAVVVGVDVAIGHQKQSTKYGDLFPLNSRPSRVRLVVGDWSKEFDLADIRDLQPLAVPSVEARNVRLIVLDTYAGSRWQDTSVNTVQIRVAL